MGSSPASHGRSPVGGAPLAIAAVAEGIGGKAALRSLKHKISDSIYAQMIDDARPHPPRHR